ncbi:aminotransferase class I/II-fold pyridoxal phosphate-dependent enzyme [Actinosynnema sp. NPDC023794]
MDDDGALRLHCNESPYGPPPEALKAAAVEVDGRSGTYPDNEALDVRQSVAEHFGVGVDMVEVGNGADELLLLTTLALTRPGDAVLVTETTFPGYVSACRVADATPRTVPLRDLRLDVPALLDALADVPVLAYVCNPHNPTGTVLDPADVERIIATAEAAGVVAVFDEAYMEFAGPAYEHAVAAVAAGRRLLVLRTFSKAWGLAGLRLGCVLGPPDLIGRLRHTRRAVPFSVNRPAQAAVVAALGHRGFVDEVRRRTAEARARLCAGLTELGVGHVASATNFVLVRTGGDSTHIADRLAAEHGVLVRDLAVFGLPGHLRVTVGTPAQVDAFCAALRDVLPRPHALTVGLGAPPDVTVPTLDAPTLPDLFNGYVGTQVAFALSELGVWEELAAGSRSVAALADRGATSPTRLRPLLRTAALLGYVELVGETATLTAAGRDLVRHLGFIVWGVGGYGSMLLELAGLATGKVAFGREVRRDEDRVAAGSGMAGRTLMRPVEEEVLAGLEFASVADIGCGDGSRLVRLCGADPGRRGVGIDISADACAAATGRVRAAGLADRVEIVHDDVLRQADGRVFPGVDLVTSFLMMHDLFAATGDPAGVMVSLREAFPDARRFLIADTVGQDWDRHRGPLPAFSLEFELVHAFMDTPILGRDTYERAFADADLRVERRVPFGSPSTWLYALTTA